MFDRYIYFAKFINEEIIINQYRIFQEDIINVIVFTENNHKIIYKKSDVAFSIEDALRILVNSYTDRIESIAYSIHRKEQELKILKSLIPELMFEQRKVESRKRCIDH